MARPLNSPVGRRIFVVFLVFLSLTTPVSATSVIESWVQKLDAAERDLHAREWDAAYRKTEEVSRDVMRHLRGGAGAEELLARIFVLQALAEAGRGNERLARWNWEAALELHPPMEKLRLDSYGEAERILRQEPKEVEKDDIEEEDLKDVRAPRRRFSPKPDFPRGRLDKQGLIIVRVVIDTEGQVWSPHVLEDHDEPLMVYATLKTMRDWEFAPATLDGEPVDVYYNLTLGFNRSGFRDEEDEKRISSPKVESP